jgi:hypothetical protein
VNRKPCGSLSGRLRRICEGSDPRCRGDSRRRQIERLLSLQLIERDPDEVEQDNGESTPKVHEEKFVQTLINERASTKSPKQAKAKPSLLAKAASLGKAMLTHAKDRFRTASAEEQESRLVICRTCEKYEPADGSCKLCGCCMKLKTRLRTGSCPIGKWGIADARPAIHADASADPEGMREDPGGMDGGGNAQTGASREPTRQAEVEGVAPG